MPSRTVAIGFTGCAIRMLAKACGEMSRRDKAIVAWHEVPYNPVKSIAATVLGITDAVVFSSCVARALNGGSA